MNVYEQYSELYHYTTASGLKGILESQLLYATSISFLNDSDEHRGFFDKRLPELLKRPVEAAVKKAFKSPRKKKLIEQQGGKEKAMQELLRGMAESLRNATKGFNDPYVVSFCAPPEMDRDDGLLSQWRGYGQDGGFAIVFDTAKLNELIRVEAETYYYQLALWGDVNYSPLADQQLPVLPEIEAYEKALAIASQEFLEGGGPASIEPVLEPITYLSTTHKHRGFREEREVRIVLLRPRDDLTALARQAGEPRKVRVVNFRERDGVVVPYIEVFGSSLGPGNAKLPIKRIIVGPHMDRARRKESIQNLLHKLSVDAPVLMSSIPYLGT